MAIGLGWALVILLILSSPSQCLFGQTGPASGKGGGAEGMPAVEDPLFANIAVVEAATLHAQTLEEAPASVTLITAEEIRKFGYRTLGEALASVRGFYFTNDRNYDYSGVRGLAIPGDWNSRFLVMINSHPLTENVYNSNNFFGQDFGLDMDLVDRIEVIRGPSSALFGSNGMLATINVITKSPVDHPRVRASVETASFGEKKAILSSSVELGRGANLLISTSVFNNGGRTLYYPDFDAPETNGGIAERVDAQRGYHTLANLTWGGWSFLGSFNARRINVPAGGGESVFNSPGQFSVDSRSFVSSSYTRNVGGNGQLRWQTSYDQYRYRDRYDYPLEDEILDNRSESWGDWLRSQLIYSRPVAKLGTFTAGVQGIIELRNRQINRDQAPEPALVLDVRAPDRIASVFAQQEWVLRPKLTAYLGLRFDSSGYYGNFASPRLALVYQATGKDTYKFVYGRPFRNPSAFERFYDDNGLSYAANPALSRETAQALEVSWERKLRPDLMGLVNAFHYELNAVIESSMTPEELIFYRNAGTRRSTGVEFELRGRLKQTVELSGSWVTQKPVNVDSGVILPNAPRQLAKARAAVPLVRNRVYLSSGFQYLGARTTNLGAQVRPVALADLTLSTRRLFQDYDLVCGIRNGLNWQYDHPVDLSMDRIRANGRTFFVKLIWQSGG